MKTYILQKDLPNLKAGAEFVQEKSESDYYCEGADMFYHYNLVENSPDWFKPKEDEPVNNTYQFTRAEIMELYVKTNPDVMPLILSGMVRRFREDPVTAKNTIESWYKSDLISNNMASRLIILVKDEGSKYEIV